MTYYFTRRRQPKGAPNSALGKQRLPGLQEIQRMCCKTRWRSIRGPPARKFQAGNFPVAGGFPIVLKNRSLAHRGRWHGGHTAGHGGRKSRLEELNAIIGKQPDLLP